MGSPTLIQVLTAAGIANAENYCLASGVSLAGEITEMDGVRGVPISDDREQASRFVPLSDISSIIRRDQTTFTTPSVFRSIPVAACSAEPVSKPEHDYELDACYEPTPENLDEIVRQIASGDRDQASAGKESLDYGRNEAIRNGTEEEFNTSLEVAMRQASAEYPEEAASIERSCQQYQHSTLPESLDPTPGLSDSDTPSAVAFQEVVAGDSGGGTVPVLHTASVSIETDSIETPVVLNASDSSASGLVVGRSEGDDDPVDLFAPVCSPVTVTISNAILPALIGISMIPGNGPQLFQNLFGAMEGASLSPIVQTLTSSNPRLWLFQEAVRGAVSGVLRNFLGGSSSPSEQRTLSFRYVPEGRVDERPGLEILLAPVRRDRRPISLPAEDDASTGFASLPTHFSNYVLALFSGVRRSVDSMTENVTVFVPFLPPSQYMFARPEARSAVGSMIHDSHATDRAPAKISSRGDSPDGDPRRQREEPHPPAGPPI